MTGADDTEDDSDGASRPGVNSRLIGTEHARFDQCQERLTGESALALALALSAPIANEWRPVGRWSREGVPAGDEGRAAPRSPASSFASPPAMDRCECWCDPKRRRLSADLRSRALGPQRLSQRQRCAQTCVPFTFRGSVS